MGTVTAVMVVGTVVVVSVLWLLVAMTAVDAVMAVTAVQVLMWSRAGITVVQAMTDDVVMMALVEVMVVSPPAPSTFVRTFSLDVLSGWPQVDEPKGASRAVLFPSHCADTRCGLVPGGRTLEVAHLLGAQFSCPIVLSQSHLPLLVMSRETQLEMHWGPVGTITGAGCTWQGGGRVSPPKSAGVGRRVPDLPCTARCLLVWPSFGSPAASGKKSRSSDFLCSSPCMSLKCSG